MTHFSKKWSNRKATRKWRGIIQSQDQELQTTEFRVRWLRQLWIAAVSCKGTTYLPRKDNSSSRRTLSTLEAPMSYTELPQPMVLHITVLSIHLTIFTIELAKSSGCLRAVKPSLQQKNFPQQGRLEGWRGDQQSHPSARQPHSWGKAFNLSELNFSEFTSRWVQLSGKQQNR